MKPSRLAYWQNQVDKVTQKQGGYWHPLSILARITEEVGEAARLLNHLYGDKPKKPAEASQELSEELGDILYAVICLANLEGINLDKAMSQVVKKAKTRDKDRFKTK